MTAILACGNPCRRQFFRDTKHGIVELMDLFHEWSSHLSYCPLSVIYHFTQPWEGEMVTTGPREAAAGVSLPSKSLRNCLEVV